MASTIKTIRSLIYGLEDALSFMGTFDEYAEESFGCYCDADVKKGEKCECITEDGHLRVVSKEKIVENAKKLLAEMVEEEENKFYKRYDLQDESDYSIETLEEMRIWLADFWGENPDEDMEDEEHDAWIQEILQADAEELFDMLSGVDYSYCEVDENNQEILHEVKSTGVFLGHGYSVMADKRNVVEMTLTRGEDKQTLLAEPENWMDTFHKQVEILQNELKKEQSI